MSDRIDLNRAIALQRWLLETTSTRSEELAWGTAFFNEEFPIKYDANMILADRPLGDVSTAEVIETVDRLYDGMEHREIAVVDEADGERLAFGLSEQGYVIDRLVIMAHARDPDREPDLDLVEPIAPADARALQLEVRRREPWGREPGVPEELVAHSEFLLRAVDGTLLVQRCDGVLAGFCELYVHGDVAQVESVNTLEEFRGRGVGRNLVLRAVHEAKTAGATLVFLFADQDDWPQQLYRRMGFEPIGAHRIYMQVPENERSSHHEISRAE